MTEDEDFGISSAPTNPITKKFSGTQSREILPQQYIMSKKDIKPLARIESSFFKNGYVRGTFYGFIGVPGAGKTRLAIQEVYFLAEKGYQCLYLYNESSRNHFDNYVDMLCKQMHVNLENPNITWCDMSEQIQKVASYEGIETWYDKFWTQQTRHWLESHKNPGVVVTDSFSNVARRFIPQMWEAHQDYVTGLTELITPLDKKPVFIEVHQKSGSVYERDNDSVVGGFGLTHQLDANIVFMSRRIKNKWDSERYGIPEGKNFYSLYAPKDRFGSPDFEETQIVLENGKLKLKDKISELVEQNAASPFRGGVNFEEEP